MVEARHVKSLVEDSLRMSATNVSTPTCLDDFEELARSILPHDLYHFYASYADEGQTKKDCCEAFRRYRLRPRVLRDVSERNMSTTCLGQPVSFPVGIAPTAAHKFAHFEGERATAKAAAKSQIPMIVSNCANTTLKDISTAAPNGLHWIQIHIWKSRKLVRRYVRAAEMAGFKAIVVTVDLPVLGYGHNNARMKPREEWRLINAYDPKDQYTENAIANGDIALWDYISDQLNDRATWNDVRWLRGITRLPIVAKGILTAESALEAVEYGVKAIIVSAHGGRHLDGVPATIDALSEVVNAVKGTDVEVYLDGGVRKGTDVFKALALGARAVFLGRPILWGLAYDGENGVHRVLEMLRNEFSSTMALTGCSRLEDIQRSMVIHESNYLISKL